jgi:hypothetical protein
VPRAWTGSTFHRTSGDPRGCTALWYAELALPSGTCFLPPRPAHATGAGVGEQQPCVQDKDGTTKCPTSFPAPSAMASAFNTTLYYLVCLGTAKGTE